jgi:F-type H+-transporting ATPase subunit a
VEQLEHPSPLVDAVNALVAPFGMHVPNYLVFCALITLIVLVVGLIIRSRLSVDNPGKLQIVLEDITTFIVAQLENVIGPGKGRRYMALCGGIFIFILIGNLMGQVPGLGAPTSNINVPFGCALTVWLYYHWQGIRAQGPIAYVMHFAFPPGVPKALAPLMLPIELISHLSRVLSLTLRLFGNMVGGHILLAIIFFLMGLDGLIGWALSGSAAGAVVGGLGGLIMIAFTVGFLYPLKLLVAFLQAFIFVMLTMLYISGAIEEAEHHAEHHS